MLQRTAALCFPFTWDCIPRRNSRKTKTKNVNGLRPATAYILSLLAAVRRVTANIFKLQRLECSLFACPSSTRFKDTSAFPRISMETVVYYSPRGLPLPLGPLRNTLQDLRLRRTARKRNKHTFSLFCRSCSRSLGIIDSKPTPGNRQHTPRTRKDKKQKKRTRIWEQSPLCGVQWRKQGVLRLKCCSTLRQLSQPLHHKAEIRGMAGRALVS